MSRVSIFVSCLAAVFSCLRPDILSEYLHFLIHEVPLNDSRKASDEPVKNHVDLLSSTGYC
jgi:hypothetical protein